MMGFHGTKDLLEGLGFALVVGTAIGLALEGEISSGGILTLAMLYNKASQPLQKVCATYHHHQQQQPPARPRHTTQRPLLPYLKYKPLVISARRFMANERINGWMDGLWCVCVQSSE